MSGATPLDAAAVAQDAAQAPQAALLLIGNELLSGRTTDANLAHLASRLGTRGIRLAEARVVADVPAAIVRAVDELRGAHDLLFTTGGIGPTHDDITADCIAEAFGVGIDIHPEARERLETFWAARGITPNEDRLRMARIPDGATLIDNEVSAAPGFRLANVFVLAGVPRIMASMLEHVLPTLPSGPLVHVASVIATDVGEGEIATPLRELQARYPAVDLGSYPGRVDGRSRVELVARATDEIALAEVHGELRALLARLGGGRGDG